MMHIKTIKRIDDFDICSLKLIADAILIYARHEDTHLLRILDGELAIKKELTLNDFEGFKSDGARCELFIDELKIVIINENTVYVFDFSLKLIKKKTYPDFNSIYSATVVGDYYFFNSSKELADEEVEKYLLINKNSLEVEYFGNANSYSSNIVLHNNKILAVENKSKSLGIYDFPSMQEVIRFNTGNIGYSEIHKSGGDILKTILFHKGLAIFSVTFNHMIAIDINDGKIIWDIEFNSDTPHCYFLENDIIYFTSRKNFYYKINPATGQIVFQKDHTKALEPLQLRGLTTKTAPLILDNTIFVGYIESNIVACLDKNAGDLLWYYKCKDQIKETPIRFNHKLLVYDFENNIYLFEGEELK